MSMPLAWTHHSLHVFAVALIVALWPFRRPHELILLCSVGVEGGILETYLTFDIYAARPL